MASKMQPHGSKLASNLAAIVVVFLLGACALEPSTIVKTTRTLEAINGETAPDGETPDAENEAELPPEITDALQEPDQVAAVEIDLTNFKERLLGLDSNEIIELLGKPKFEREEPPAQIWQYQSNECFVDLFLFIEANNLTVDHVEVRGKKVEKADEKSCFASILNAANGGEGKPAPVGPLRPAPGAVKVPPVTQGIPEENNNEDLTPPSLINEEPEVPSFGAEEPPLDPPADVEEPDMPSFGPEDPPEATPEKAPKESEEEMPSFGPEEPAAPKTGQEPINTGNDEEAEPEIEFKMEPVPSKPQEAEPSSEEPPEPVAAPETEPEPESAPIAEPEGAPSTVEEDSLDSLRSSDDVGRDPLISEEEEELNSDTKIKAEELPNAPKLGTTQTEDDLLEDPAP